ncbi:MAG: PaREP1 family protein [Chloroflexota bacterium]|nr:PaREP1 family protein [Chloroflexota bacterium]MDE2684760.1 PaREP1 family protein [Chloroflexota bacterium]
MVAHTYHTASRQLLAQGRAELDAGDVRQASEKGWGAAAQMVKALAEQRGWQHRSHAALYDVISYLVSETREHEIRRLFGVANALHINFYENWNNAENVSNDLDDVERFLDKLEPLVATE